MLEDKIFENFEDFTNFLNTEYGKENAKKIRNKIDYSEDPYKRVSYKYWKHDGDLTNIVFFQHLVEKDFSSNVPEDK